MNFFKHLCLEKLISPQKTLLVKFISFQGSSHNNLLKDTPLYDRMSDRKKEKPNTWLELNQEPYDFQIPSRRSTRNDIAAAVTINKFQPKDQKINYADTEFPFIMQLRWCFISSKLLFFLTLTLQNDD